MRTFIAVDVSLDNAAVIARLQAEIRTSAGWNVRDVKSVESDNFHFTLIFLGEISETDLEKIKSKLSEIEFESFPINYTSVGTFPKSSSAKVIWIGIDPRGAQKLRVLADMVVVKTAEVGFKSDKPFSPHMTIFRIKGNPVGVDPLLLKYEGKVFGSDMVDKVQLKKSDLTPAGPIYSNIYTVEAKR